MTVDRGSSKHFDIGITFDIAITTSDSPYLAGQPSDVIIGGGINLRFLSAIEVYVKTTPGDEFCLAGKQTVEFIPERITTYVMSVYDREDDRAFGQGGPGCKLGGHGYHGRGHDPEALKAQLQHGLGGAESTGDERSYIERRRTASGGDRWFKSASRRSGMAERGGASELTEFVAGIENLAKHKPGVPVDPAPGDVSDGGTSERADEEADT